MPLLGLDGVSVSFGAVRRCGTRGSSSRRARCTGWSARTARASRRWSRSSPACTAPTRARSGSTGAPSRSPARPTPGPPASRSSTRSRRSSRTSRSPRTSSWADSRSAPACAASTGGDAAPQPPTLFARLGVHVDPDRPARGPVDRRPAAGRDRQGALVRRPRARDGRADRGAVRRGGGAAVRGRPVAAGRRRRGAVHLAPLRRGLRAVRPGHGDARRPLGLHRPDRGPHRRPGRAPDGRPRGRPRCIPKRRRRGPARYGWRFAG